MKPAIKTLKCRKAAGVDNVSAELTTRGDVLHSICNKIWDTGKWSSIWTKSIIITIPKKGNHWLHYGKPWKKCHINRKLIRIDTIGPTTSIRNAMSAASYWTTVSHVSWSSAWVSALPNPLQHLSRRYHDTAHREL